MSSAAPAEAVVLADRVERSGAPATGIYQIGSVTKVFTGLLLAREVVDGALSLDQPVSDLLPELASVPTGSATLGSLASHTSGLPRLPPGLWRKALGKGRRDPYADIDGPALVAALRDVRLRRPGGRAAYSNLGYGLLGHALATHRATTYDAAVRERITGPLGMSDTGCVPADPARVVVGTTRRGKPHQVAWSVRRPGRGGRPVVDRRRPGALPPGAARAARGSARRGDAALAPAAHQRAHRDGAGVGAALRT